MKDGHRRQEDNGAVYTIHRDAFQAVLAGLVEAEELYECMADPRYGGGSPDREDDRENRTFLSRYISELNRFIRQCAVTDHRADAGDIPFAVAGALITVEHLPSRREYALCIVGPGGFRRGDGRGAAVPMLSPVGRAVLLARPGEVVTVPGADGGFSYRIVAVSPPPVPRGGPAEGQQRTER